MPTNTKALQVAEPTPFIAGKNGFINGGMDIWQRGTSIAMTTSNYGPDRVGLYRSGGGATISKQSSGLVNIPNCARIQRDSGNTSTGTVYIGQPMDVASSAPFIGQTVTFSFYARAGANYSPTSSALVAKIYTGTNTTDYDGFHGSYTGQANPITSTVTLTSSWQRFTVTGSIPSTAVQVLPQFEMFVIGTAGANDYYELTGVQLEVGSVATPFSRAAGTLQGELALCQRYYYRYGGEHVYQRHADGVYQSATVASCTVQNPVPMRAAPTSIDWSTLSLHDGTTNRAITAIAFDAATVHQTNLAVTAGGGGGTAKQFVQVLSTGSLSGYLGLSAEL